MSTFWGPFIVNVAFSFDVAQTCPELSRQLLWVDKERCCVPYKPELDFDTVAAGVPVESRCHVQYRDVVSCERFLHLFSIVGDSNLKGYAVVWVMDSESEEMLGWEGRFLPGAEED